MRYFEPFFGTAPPTTTLDLATAPPAGTVTRTNIWNGAAAPVASPLWDSSRNAGATVAAGMGKDGYIYAMRAVGAREPAWTTPPGKTWGPPDRYWRTHTRYYEILKYGRNGVDNLGIVSGLGIYIALNSDGSLGADVSGAVDFRLGPNFNAADIDPVTGIMYVANFQSSGKLNQVYKIDVAQVPPKFIGTLTLSRDIPGAQSGDFAIDINGEYAYGIATTSQDSISYRFRLDTGAVETLASGLGSDPFGAAARLPSSPSKMAFYGTSTRIMSLPDGTLGSTQSTAAAQSADGAACLPKFKVKLECTPTTLVDADDNVSICTVTLDNPAPGGGLVVALTPPADSDRYTTSCGSTIEIEPGSKTAQCTITAIPNTIPGDGSETADLALSKPGALDDYELDTPSSASVMIQNDDSYVATLTCDPTALFDSADNTSTCTVKLNGPAPAGGMAIALTPPTGGERYTTDCGDSITVGEGDSSAVCTITATPNTVPGDGSFTANLALSEPGANAAYKLGDPSAAAVTVNDDDVYIASLSCTPTTLTDSEGQVSTCTVTLSAPAPANGLPIAITPPTGNNPRYTTTCTSPLMVSAGATTASCTITAVANTVVGDGDAMATLALLAGEGYTLGDPASATVTVQDDDKAAGTPTPIPTLGQWSLMLLGLGIAGLAARRRRLH